MTIPPSRESHGTARARPAAIESVLIAEDDPIFRHLLESWLERWRYQVVTAENGLDAWNILQQPNAPQMVILDWMMPAMDGVELCRQIRSREQGIYRYVLLLTAKDEKQDIVKGLDAGADDYLTKPFNVEELRARVRSGQRILELQEALLQAHEALRYESAHDPLTGVWNRGAILELLRRENQRSQRTGSPLGVIMVDLDHFKQINDSFGHLTGDRVLREVCDRMKSCLRTYDAIGRFGGEEFVIVVPGCAPEDLMASAERLRKCVSAKPVETSLGQVVPTISLGVAPVGESTDYEALLRAADEALYIAKANGRDRAEIAVGARAGAGGEG